jgi:hypothetical protein
MAIKAMIKIAVRVFMVLASSRRVDPDVLTIEAVQIGGDITYFAAGDSVYLLTTTRLTDGRAALALAVAPLAAGQSPDFMDQGPLLISPDGGALESPQLKRIEGSELWWLFLTRGGVYGTSVLSAADFRGPWELAAAVKLDEGAAPELNAFEGTQLQETGFPPASTALLFSRHENYFEWGRYNYAIQFDLLDFDPTLDLPQLLNQQGLQGWTSWTIPGLDGPDAWLHAPTFEDNPMARGADESSGYTGHSWLSSFEDYQSVTGGIASHVGDSLGAAAVGALRSPLFTVTGERLDFLIGGAGSPDSCWVALRSAANGAELFRTAPPGGAGTGVAGGEGLPLTARAWDTRTLLGLAVNLEVIDLAQGPGGFIALDEIIWSDADPDSALPPSIPPSTLGFSLSSRPANPWLPAQGALRLGLLVEVPGPYLIQLHDPRGRRVGQLAAGDLARGVHHFTAEGGKLPSGLYLLRIGGPRGGTALKVVLLR